VRGEESIQTGGVGVGTVSEEGVSVLDHFLQVEKVKETGPGLNKMLRERVFVSGGSVTVTVFDEIKITT
jgi:hypothetical protein